MESEQKINRRQLLRNIASDVRLFTEGCSLIYLATLRKQANQAIEQESQRSASLEDPITGVLIMTGLLVASIAMTRRLPDELGTRKAN